MTVKRDGAGRVSLSTRLSGTEMTVFRISGYLLRIKQEADSDYHLVIADSGGRTMIVEVPAPQYVGSYLSRCEQGSDGELHDS